MLSKTIFGGGCFWCVEAVIQRLKGVQKVQSGYAGGYSQNPTYHEVCSGQGGHAEVVRITYNPQVLPYRDLIYIFMMTHDPTTLNRQNYDVGPQYRSIILYQNDEQLKTIKSTFEEVQKSYKDPIVTEVKKSDVFYEGEKEHQNYYNDHPGQGYCQAVIRPKIKKLQSLYSKYLDETKNTKVEGPKAPTDCSIS